MNRELGIARCGLACCLCSEAVKGMGTELCTGCDSGKCAFAPTCKSLRCSKEKGLKGCYECDTLCEEGVLGKAKVKGFIAFIQRYGMEAFLDRLEANEKKGVVYHRDGIVGDYDACKDAEEVVAMLKG
ncbi:MAG: DUF3795 domain-containing protein [Eubacteriales bacterium]|nr:DUF3795 domain-containing protein [Eubacteriales bacterium]